MEIKKVFVAGAGLMGSGISQVCASAGLKVIICDVVSEALEKALKNIAWSVGKFIEKQKVSGPLEAVMTRITSTNDLTMAAEADLCIEAVFEKLELKQEVFGRLGSVVKHNIPLASNTSAIPISSLAATVPHPERVFLPWQAHYLPEEMKGLQVSPWMQMFRNAYQWCQEGNK